MSRRPASTRPRGKERVRHAAALSPRALLGFALADVTRLLRTVYDARLSGKGLSGASWRVLAYLYREDGLTQTKLANLLEVSRPAIGQMIDRLEASGFVERRASILGAHLRLPPQHIHDHASYIGHWMKLLADDKRAFLTAAAQAQVAVDWLLTKSPSPFGVAEEAGDVAA